MLSLRLNSIIPNFNATTTIGEINFYDFVGDSWAVLFSHPLDFTPVCTTELGRMVFQFEEFKKRNVKVIGLSCDEVSSHLKWIHDIKSYCLEYEGDFPFPIIADPSRELAAELNLLDAEHEDGLEVDFTIRSLYVIDPSKKLRLAMVYPISTGRDIDEILRVIDSLQLVDKYNKIIATPVNWIPGTKIMIDSEADDDEIKRIFPTSKIVSTQMPSGRCYMHTILSYDS